MKKIRRFLISLFGRIDPERYEKVDGFCPGGYDDDSLRGIGVARIFVFVISSAVRAACRSALRLFFWLRSVYLNAVTFGAWSQLGNFTMDLAASHREDVQRNDRTEHRLNGFMRFVETDLQVTIPGDIEPPRLTSFGEDLSIAEEREMILRDQERLGKPVPCPDCDQSGVVMVALKPTLNLKTGDMARPVVPQACRRCTGSGVISAADAEAGEVQVPQQGGSDVAPGGTEGG